ncbi:MAG: N-6 DNA methylase [Candidatus Bathyarchaeota archaeon]|nr:N-6 DNA methylase [Candidatus Bathyarchaeota archaeon]MDH5788301.1 N-6 DNA methylase [Candidatus Bathyarchaeota archaeon]
MVRNQLRAISSGKCITSTENLNEKRTASYAEMLIHKNGAVYTPEKLAQYLAQKTVQYVSQDLAFQSSQHFSVIDNAVGDGVLLSSMVYALRSSEKRMRITLCGVDIDRKAIETSKKKLESLDAIDNVVLINTNSLVPFGKKDLLQGWKRIFKKASVNGGFDGLIDNPPWGADISEYKDKIDPRYFSAMQGQFDSFELFIELALHVVKKGGYFAFIVPDSILNHNKSIIRKRLLDNTEIKFIARLGEKIFPKINRACVLIICKNGPPSSANMVDCFRLPKHDRMMILQGTLTFADAEFKNAHKVPQIRFANNQFYQFDIDLRESETAVLQKLHNGLGTLGDALSSHRGVELSSSGMVCRCPNCGSWAPLSEGFSVKCRSCGRAYNPQLAEKTNIVFREHVPNSLPLITGSDLKRYVGNPSRWIKTDKKGINYKPKSLYDAPKILVRKTGVGLTATLDYSSSYTTQVVYIFRTKSPSWPDLEFFIALINSRAYYFYLSKSFGELEWRSHPYLTQSQILSLPIPNLDSKRNKKIAKKIISLIRPILKEGRKPSTTVDLEVERLIGKAFSLTKNDYKIILNAIDESDELLPILDLKSLGAEELLKTID